MTDYPHIERDRNVCGGTPHVKGTRITVSLIAREAETLRMSPDEIIAAHPHLTLAQVHSALAYFYDHRAEIEALMETAERIEADLLERFPARVQGLLALK